MVIHWPQGVLVFLMISNLGIVMAKHGKPKDREYNFWYSLLDFLIVFSLLYCGGFFKS